jgi:pimeloyl-ACP methyl ester carboxylesterase
MKVLRWLTLCIAVFLGVYFLGPAPDKPTLTIALPIVNSDLLQLEQEIIQSEQKQAIKPNNEARIIWANDSLKQKTEYSVVYLHGFSASQQEGAPIHTEFAKRYGCNLYLARLYGHGLNTAEPLLDLKPENYLESANQAIAIGKQLGEKVIIMSTSTGGTQAMFIASEHPEIAALILYSPNIKLYDPSAFILTKPWGLQLARMVMGSKYREREDNDSIKKYWYSKYRLEGVISMQSLLEEIMTEEVFSNIKQPVFLAYYYKDEENQDNTVSVTRMLEMYDELGTAENQKRKVAFPEAASHVIASSLTSKAIDEVREETFKFAEEILKLKPTIK